MELSILQKFTKRGRNKNEEMQEQTGVKVKLTRNPRGQDTSSKGTAQGWSKLQLNGS